MSQFDIARLVALVLIAVLFVLPGVLHTTPNLTVALRNIALWLAVAVAISIGYQVLN